MMNDKIYDSHRHRKSITLSITIVLLLLLPNISIGDTSLEFQGDVSLEDTDFDDCESNEVIIDEIISPSSHEMTGTYDITANFTAVGITINGNRDCDKNEPWIKHEKSPDNNGTPKIDFYTSCDEKFMYTAFENKTGGITEAEIFIDKNMNGTWDYPYDDTFFTINSSGPNSSKVKDHNGNPVPNSEVGWGNQQSFVEIKIPKTYWSDCQDWAYVVYSSCFCPSNPKNPSWDNDSHPTPPDGEFLSSTCCYSYNCSCGIAFKALADIFEIIPGECNTIYETDFENLSDVAQEWENKTFDENPDTWKLSENRSNSSTHSYHCTKNLNYYGNAVDVLQMKDSLNLSDANNVSFSFWHWCKGDAYTSNNHTKIADYGDVEMHVKIDGNWSWISLSDLGISNLYYDNNWIRTTIEIEKSKSYPLDGKNISGEDLLINGVKFRFVWRSSPQFQYEGWYIDDIKIKVCKDEWYDPDQPIWQSQSLSPDHWCVPFGSNKVKTFPMQWDIDKEGKYLISVCIQEEPPWCGPSCLEKNVIIGNIHDVAVNSLKAPYNIDKGDDLPIEAVIENVGTYNETDVQVKATIKEEEDGSTIWQETTTIPTLNVSENKTLNFIWEDATYCDHILEVRAILPEDEIPENNSKSKNVLVATTIFEDHMNDDCNWTHSDLTGGEGHWNVCSSGYDDYLWCGIQELTKYGNNWNDVAMINDSLNLSSYDEITLTFDTYYIINESDYGYIEISTDGGRHWENIAEEFTGNSNWITKTYNISQYKTNDFVLRFRFFSNNSFTERGWIIDNITIKGNGTTLFNDNFESGTGNWIIERLKVGDWWQRIEKEKDGDTDNIAWWCGDEMSGIYPANLNNTLTLDGICADPIDFSKAFDADILFLTWYNISEEDKGFIEISNDNGVNWDALGTLTGISGSSEPGWATYSFDIKDYIGDSILIRFRFTSDNTEEGEGWYIDDFKIVAKLDNEAPVTTINPEPMSGWHTNTVSVTLSAVDPQPGSGVKSTYYKLNGGSQQEYSIGEVITLQDGVHTIEFWSEDNVGNIEVVDSNNIAEYKIDTQPPTVKITRPETGIYWHDHKLWPLFNFTFLTWEKTFIRKDITIEVDANDPTPGSGLEKVEFFIDGKSKENVTAPGPYAWNWDETAFFTKTIEVKAYDNAGHVTSDSIEVHIFNINLLGSLKKQP